MIRLFTLFRRESEASKAARLLRAKGIEKQRARQAETTARLMAEVARMRGIEL